MNSVKEQVRDQVGNQVWDQVWDQVWYKEHLTVSWNISTSEISRVMREEMYERCK